MGDRRGKSAGGSLLLEFRKRIVLPTQTLALLSTSSLCVRPFLGCGRGRDLTNGENQCREGGGRSTPLLSSFPRSKPQKGCLKKEQEEPQFAISSDPLLSPFISSLFPPLED